MFKQMQIKNFVLAYDGLNQFEVPKGAKTLTVTRAAFQPERAAVVLLGEIDAPNEIREFFVTTGGMPAESQGIKIGHYIGAAQLDGYPAQHVFEAATR
jgi:hypothetical protein